jgi:hypothetical protein
VTPSRTDRHKNTRGERAVGVLVSTDLRYTEAWGVGTGDDETELVLDVSELVWDPIEA